MSFRFRLPGLVILGALAVSATTGAMRWREISFASTSGHPLFTGGENSAMEAGSDANRAFNPDETNDDSGPKAEPQFTLYRNADGEVTCRAATAAERRQFDTADLEKLGMRAINHGGGKAKGGQEIQASNLTIVLRATAQLQQNQAATEAFIRAARNWEDIIKSPITIYIDVDYGPTNFGQSWPAGVLGATSIRSQAYQYQVVRTNLIAQANSEGNPTKQLIFSLLPPITVPTDLGEASSTFVADANARAIGLLPAIAQTTDRASRIAFNSNVTFDFDPSDGTTAGQLDFDTVATHEIGHALGFSSQEGLSLPRPSVWDLYRFRTGTTADTFATAQRILTIGGSPDPLQYDFTPGSIELGLSTGGPNGSTANGGDGWQSGHWKHVTTCNANLGVMDPAISSGCHRTITSNDILALTTFGYNLTNNNQPPAAPPPLAPPVNDDFVVAQTINGCAGSIIGTSFGATAETGEPNHFRSDSASLSPNHSVWYQWQAPASGTVTLNTSGSDFDTILSIYSGGSFGNLFHMNWNDDAQPGTLTSSITMSVTAGRTYRIGVDGWAGDAGNIKLNWSGCASPPMTCPSALTVNDNGDSSDANAGDGLCATAGGACTLRAAIQEANALLSCGEININFSIAGTIILGTALPDVNHIININGPGSSDLTVRRNPAAGTPEFRIMNITETTVRMAGLTVSGGLLENHGSGIQSQGVLTLTDVTVAGNSTRNVGLGGGINNQGGMLTLIDSTVKNNTANGGSGGGINNNLAGTAVLINTTVSDNIASFSAGGIRENGGSLTLLHCTVSRNSLRGISTTGSTKATIIDSTVSNNLGGGIENFGTLTLTNSTVAGNGGAASFGGGGIQAANVSTTVIKNSIIATNAVSAGSAGPDLQGTFNSQDYNLIGNTSGATFTGTTTHNLTNVNALLGPLANNGGRTMTHGLLPGSPAIDAGNNVLAVDAKNNPLVTDQRGVGFSRIINGTVDIGAFESQGPAPIVQLGAPSFNANESDGQVSITVVRVSGGPDPFTVNYSTSDAAGTQNCNLFNGKASARCDYITASGTLTFGPNENAKTVSILISDDSYAEGPETIAVSLSNPVGATLGSQSTATTVINDNDGSTGPNPIDHPGFFVRQNYLDFLNREPDTNGLNFWTGTFTQCGSDPQCIEVIRINVSAAFFLSIEFQNTGYLVERIYKASYGDAAGTSTFNGPHPLPVPMVRLDEFLVDTQEIARGVVVNQGDWQAQLENNKQAFTEAFVQRPRFTSAFPASMSAIQFVDQLNSNAGNPLSASERIQLFNELGGHTKTRAQVLRAVAEHPNLYASEFNRAFVLMQYFGYLRRNPNDPQDNDYTGYDFWLVKLNQFGGNYHGAEMVKAFISSIEYRQRFGP
jgi:hypothetical protein